MPSASMVALWFVISGNIKRLRDTGFPRRVLMIGVALSAGVVLALGMVTGAVLGLAEEMGEGGAVMLGVGIVFFGPLLVLAALALTALPIIVVNGFAPSAPLTSDDPSTASQPDPDGWAM